MIITKYPFSYNPNGESNVAVYPDLRYGSHTFTIQTNTVAYIVLIKFNIFTEALECDVSDGVNTLVLSNIPVQHGINILLDKSFEGYYLIFNKTQTRFEFGDNT